MFPKSRNFDIKSHSLYLTFELPRGLGPQVAFSNPREQRARTDPTLAVSFHVLFARHARHRGFIFPTVRRMLWKEQAPLLGLGLVNAPSHPSRFASKRKGRNRHQFCNSPCLGPPELGGGTAGCDGSWAARRPPGPVLSSCMWF